MKPVRVVPSPPKRVIDRSRCLLINEALAELVGQRAICQSLVGQAARDLSITRFGGLTVHEGRLHTPRLSII